DRALLETKAPGNRPSESTEQRIRIMISRCTKKYRQRAGAVAPLVALCLVAMFGFIALSIDLGVIAVARNQCQDAADSAALAGARTLTGNQNSKDSNGTVDPYLQNQALANAQTLGETNFVLNKQLTANNVVVSVGQYYYSDTTTSFTAWPTDSGSAFQN